MTARIPKMQRLFHAEKFRKLMAEQHQPRWLHVELISVQDLARELGLSVRILQRWNKRADAPERFLRGGRQRCYRIQDVESWCPVITRRRVISMQRGENDG